MKFIKHVTRSKSMRTVRVARVVKPLPSEGKIVVYDIEVKETHNFFIRPKGTVNSVCIHNCSPAGFQCFLKPLEEPPARTTWIIATTNPEKLPTAVQNRALNWGLKRITPEMIAERIIYIADKEGMDLDNKLGRRLAMSIAGYSNGEVRRAISILENVLLSYQGNKKADLAATVERFASMMEASAGKLATKLILSVLKKSAKGVIACATQVDSCRSLQSNARWMVTSMLEEYAGVLKFRSYGYKELKKQMAASGVNMETGVLIPYLLKLQARFNAMEMMMNTNLDDKMVFIAGLGEFMIETKYK
jgi:DNA polymerase III gamma/tau subunit